jgi:hypothetical protein
LCAISDEVAIAAGWQQYRGAFLNTLLLLLLLLPCLPLPLLLVQVGAIKDLCDLVFNPPDGK